jgi:hypothetical protein
MRLPNLHLLNAYPFDNLLRKRLEHTLLKHYRLKTRPSDLSRQFNTLPEPPKKPLFDMRHSYPATSTIHRLVTVRTILR